MGLAANRREPDASAANVRPIIATIQAAGITRAWAIAEELNARQLARARGEAWSGMQVSRILARAA